MIGRAACHPQVLLLGLLVFTAPAVAVDPAADEVAARVNGSVISRKAVRDVVQALAATRDEPPNAEQVEQLTRDALDSLVGFELLYQESQRRGVAVTDAEIDAALARTKARFRNPNAYENALAQQGLNAADVRRDTRKTLGVNRLLEQTAWKDISITSAQVRQFYEANREQFKRPAEIRASHILMRAPHDAPAGEQARVKQQIEALLTQLRSGADFAELARQHSNDPGTAAKGGDLGFFARGAMEPEFEQAAFALKPGVVSDVVQTRYGFHLIKVTDQRPAGYAPLGEVEAGITDLLRDEEKRRRQDQFVATLKQQAKVELLPLLKPTVRPVGH